jgi:phosphonate dehydrogenase
MSSALPSPPRIVVTNRIHSEIAAVLAAHGSLVINDSPEPWLPGALLEQARDAQALMVFMPDCLDQEFLSRCPNLWIVAGALKGADNFDVGACTRMGIWFTVVPDLLSGPTAELALALLLGLIRNVRAGDQLIRGGRYQGWRPILYGTGLSGGVAGLIGFGAVGRALARMLKVFGCDVLVCDPAIDLQTAAEYGVQTVPLEKLLSSSDFVLPLVPLTDRTFHLLNAKTISQMKRGSYVVNVSRGSVVDEQAIADALESGHLSGFAADTFEMEDWARPDRPREITSRLLQPSAPTLLTPHLGSAVAAARLEIERFAAGNIVKALQSQRPSGAVNRPPHPRNQAQ